jgi:hypothetical protein
MKSCHTHFKQKMEQKFLKLNVVSRPMRTCGRSRVRLTVKKSADAIPIWRPTSLNTSVLRGQLCIWGTGETKCFHVKLKSKYLC